MLPFKNWICLRILNNKTESVTSGTTLMHHENTMRFFRHHECCRFRRLIISAYPSHLKGEQRKAFIASVFYIIFIK